MHHEWARPEATNRSYELFARHVMPHFQGTRARLVAAEDHARARWNELDRRHAEATRAATERHAVPVR
jgi:limonene 1,2-monooxygenase